MKVLVWLFPLFLLISCAKNESRPPFQSINPVIGDVSFIKTFGYYPSSETDDRLRIHTHLLYVEALLRERTAEEITLEEFENRQTFLNMLHAYALEGKFPENRAYANRKPCFIDGSGTICAVGYLVEQSAGRKAAEYINGRFQYAEVLDMEDDLLAEWVEKSGFSKKEIAMIQPTYGPPPPTKNVNAGYSFVSRLEGHMNHRISLGYSKLMYAMSYRRSSMRSIQLSADLPVGDNDLFGMGLDYRTSLRPLFKSRINTFMGIGANFTKREGLYAANLRPEIGFRVSRNIKNKLNVSLIPSYAYDVPVYNENAQTNRHQLSAQLALFYRFK